MPPNHNNNNNNNDALMELLSPDGYYTYLGVSKPVLAAIESTSTTSNSNNLIDDNNEAYTIKKNYRKLSLKHHPDKPGGDADTFRILNRAQKVLMNPKLRQQYDILGIDLDDDDDDLDEDDDHHHREEQQQRPEVSSSQKIVQEIAGTVLTGIIQFGVRTLMMGMVSVILVRYRWTLYPALAFLAFIIFQIIRQQHTQSSSSSASGSFATIFTFSTLPPFLIGTGLLLMSNASNVGGGIEQQEFVWSKQYWVGESLVIFMFSYNSLPVTVVQNVIILGGLAAVSIVMALWFRGKFWNYAIVVLLIAVIAIFAAIAFPVMELLLEAILNEKLKKVGDKVRHHHQMLQKHYEKKSKQRDQ